MVSWREISNIHICTNQNFLSSNKMNCTAKFIHLFSNRTLNTVGNHGARKCHKTGVIRSVRGEEGWASLLISLGESRPSREPDAQLFHTNASITQETRASSISRSSFEVFLREKEREDCAAWKSRSWNFSSVVKF